MEERGNTFKQKDHPKDKAKKERKPTTSKPSRWAWLRSDKFLRVSGLFLLLCAVFLCLAFVSYLFHWQTDYDVVKNAAWYQLLGGGKEYHTQNIMGNIGALASFVFFNNWFGLGAFGIPFLLFLLGVKLFFNTHLLPLGKSLLHTVVWMLLLSTTLSFVFPDRLLILGGAFGYEMQSYLSTVLGKAGGLLALFFVWLSYGVLAFNFSLKWPSIGSRKAKEAAPADAADTAVVLPSGNRFVAQTDETDDVADLEGDSPNAEPENEFINEDDFVVFDSTQDRAASSFADVPLSAVQLPETDAPEFSIQVAKGVDADALPIATIEGAGLSDADKERMNLLDVTSENEEFDLEDFDPTLELSHYQYPQPELLENHGAGKARVEKAELEANKNRILETLKNYNIDIQKIQATIGPTVTLYEIVPAAGVRISKIKNLEDDIALSLAALGIRIIAPMPGKGTIGIEVPNQHPEVVAMRTVLSHEKFTNTSMDLPVALGKTISNEVFIADLAKMPHLLMAGATGQGKSVGLNAILVSLLYKKHPSQIKFVLVDPKKVELTLFNKIERHFLAKLPDTEDAIITDTKKVVATLNSLCKLMDDRYDLLKMALVRNIKEYNAKFLARKLNPRKGHHFMPYIVLVIDEFADLIMTAGKEVELPIARLAQLARAIGIHLIIATQRPSVNIITGTIKANFPARIAFRVSAKIDSRTILDTGGADQLIGRGDMLLSTGSDLIRLQCPFVDTPEVDRICDFIGQQQGYASAFELPEYVDEKAEMDDDDPELSGERDPMFDEAATIVVMHQQGSASLLQRKLKLGYSRAGRIIDQLERAQIIGPSEGSKARKVLVRDTLALEQFLKSSYKD